MKKIDWNKYLNLQYNCDCGRMHQCDIQNVVVEQGAVEKIPQILSEYGHNHVCLVCDTNTLEAGGKKVCDSLDKTKIDYNIVIFKDQELVPDEKAVAYLLTEISDKAEFIIGIGSGTINDLCKFVSFKMKLDYMIVATAPSMDGYASSGAPLIINHLKTTYNVKPPKSIIADLDIISHAPLNMIAAGIGDMIGKYVCLADWEIAHLVTGEYICKEVMELVQRSVEDVVSKAGNAMQRDPAAIEAITNGLILTGIAMSYVGNSRPASGSEHHISHYWEMMALLEGRQDFLHGTKVGIGTVISLYLYKNLGKKQFLSNRPVKFQVEDWKEEIRMVYGPAAEGVIELEAKTGKNSDKNVAARKEALQKCEKEIMKIIENLPLPGQIIKILQGINAPCFPRQIGVSEEMLKRSICYAKELRNRFGLLQLLYDLGIQQEMSEQVIQQLYT